LLRAGDFQALRADIQRCALGFGLDEKIRFTDSSSIVSVVESAGITREHVMLWGSGEPFREFLHVDDLAAACLMLMERYDYRNIGEFLNVGAGEDMRIKDLALLVKEIVGFEGDIRHDMTKKDGMPRKLLDSSRARELGWSPVIGLAGGIQQTYTWYQQQNELSRDKPRRC
jgi:GDP-L-fucose synthase